MHLRAFLLNDKRKSLRGLIYCGLRLTRQLQSSSRIKKMELEEYLNKMNCIQTWDFGDYPDICQILLEKSKKIQMYNIRSYVTSFELFRKKEYFQALDWLYKAEQIESDEFMTKYKKCFKHIIMASKAFCLYKLNQDAQAKEIVDVLANESYADFEIAGFFYLKSMSSLRYERQGAATCIIVMEKAVELVPEEPVFHYHLGVVMSRMRRYKFPRCPPTDKELFHLRKATHLCKDNPWYICRLAQSYNEIDNTDARQKQIFKDYSMTLMREALLHCEQLNGSTIARCIYNIMKVHFDPKLEAFAELAKEKSSNSTLVNHYVGFFYLWNNQLDKALACFEIASMSLPYLVGLSMLIRYRVNNDYIYEDYINNSIVEAHSRFSDPDDLTALDISLSEFFLFVLEDFNQAVHFFNCFLDINSDLRQVRLISLSKKFRSVNYIMVMIKEIISYKGQDQNVLEVKKRVVQLVCDQKIKYSLIPLRRAVINALY